MQAALAFIYTGDLDPVMKVLKDPENLNATLSVVVQYQLSALQSLAEGRMKKALSLTTVKDILLTANLFNLSSLKVSCLEFIRRNAAKLLFEPSVTAIAKENPELWTELSLAVAGNKRQKTN